jgi:hypothetical protein
MNAAIEAEPISSVAPTKTNEIVIWLFLIAFLWFPMQVLLGVDASSLGRGQESIAVAKTLASTGEFADPFGSRTGPTAHIAPMYPFVVAATMKAFGMTERMVVYLVLINGVMLASAVCLLPLLSRLTYRTDVPGVIAAALMLLSSKAYLQSEAVCAQIFLILAAVLILVGRSVAAGFASGLALLANPVAVLILLPVAGHRGKRFAAIVFALAGCVVAPWVLRNWVVIGAPFFVRDNLGLELHVSNQDIAGPELIRNRALIEAHPSTNAGEAELVRDLGERRYNQRRLADAVGWIVSHRTRFFRLTTLRTLYYWLPPWREGWQSCGYWLVTGLSAVGFWLGRRNRTSNMLAIASLLCFLPYAVIQADVRYRYLALWMQALPAGYAAIWLFRRVRDRGISRS